MEESKPEQTHARRTGPRVRGLKRPPLRHAFAGRFLDQGRRPRRKLRNVSEVARYLVSLSLKDWDGVPVTGPDPERDERIARMMAVEVMAALERNGGAGSRHWYTDALRRAVGVLSLMQPEILCDATARQVSGGRLGSAAEARTVLFAALAITSQSVPVHENLRNALDQYRRFLEHGAFLPRGYGVRGASISTNLARFNTMLEIAGGDVLRLKAFLDAEFTMAEIRTAAAEVGLSVAAKELADEKVQGSALFGPKIGCFYQNLSGNLSPLTADLWFLRTWGRYTGTLVREEIAPAQIARLEAALQRDEQGHLAAAGWTLDADTLGGMDPEDVLAVARRLCRIWETDRKRRRAAGEDNESVSAFKAQLGWPGAADSIVKSMSEPVDAPINAGQRRWMRSVVARALEMLAHNGCDMTTADLQATLWWPEQAVYGFLGVRRVVSLNVSYEQAACALARREGFDDEQIQDAALRGHGYGPGAEGPDSGHGRPSLARAVRGAGAPADAPGGAALAPGAGRARDALEDPVDSPYVGAR